MGRARSRQDITRRPVASGSEWARFRRQLWQAWGPMVTCAACQHAISPGRGEVQHQVSPAVRPDLAYVVSNLRPVHSGTYRDGRGDRRCPDPSCRLACNAVLASNQVPRNADGTPVLPLPADFLARKQAERAAIVATGKRSGYGRETGNNIPGFSARPAPAPTTASPDNVSTDTGRDWDAMSPKKGVPLPFTSTSATTANKFRVEPFPPGSPEWLAARDRSAGYVPVDW